MRHIGFLSLVLLAGCQARPVLELTLADAALKSAQKAKADSLAAETYRKAENSFLRAKKDYSDGYYDSSRKFANQARQTAEQAEYKALKKQHSSKNPRDDRAGSSEREPVPSEPIE